MDVILTVLAVLLPSSPQYSRPSTRSAFWRSCSNTGLVTENTS